MSDNPKEGDLIQISSISEHGPDFMYIGDVYYVHATIRMRNVTEWRDGERVSRTEDDIFVGTCFTVHDHMINLTAIFEEQLENLDQI